MFGQQFYPTPEDVIELMCGDLVLTGAVVLEPSAGSGNIVDYLKKHGSEVIACEIDDDLRSILSPKCKVIGEDFMLLKREDVSHIDYIVMNPPFNKAVDHITHAFELAPDGCKIVALANAETMKRNWANKFLTLVDTHGQWMNIGNCFSNAARQTDVEVAMIILDKPGGEKSQFDGFFLEDEPEDQTDGIIRYDFIRDVVNRYVTAVNMFESQVDIAWKANELTKGFFSSSMSIKLMDGDKERTANEYKKELQKSAWKFIINKLNLDSIYTSDMREKINEFVEKQSQFPFSMKNIYRMIDIIIGTKASRMDKAIEKVFDYITRHHDDNRYNVEGWKTNSHYLVGMKFVFPYLASSSYRGGLDIDQYGSSGEKIIDIEKAMCFVTGKSFKSIKSIFRHEDVTDVNGIKKRDQPGVYGLEPGKWNDSEFFRYKLFKKRTVHFEFKDVKEWELFNQNVARIKGYPLFEKKQHTKYQDKNTGRCADEEIQQENKVMFKFKFKS
jgi:hypothetical protein